MLIVNDRIQIPLSEFTFTFARSGGPGGQNVNKVNSKVVLRWNVSGSMALSEEVRSRFLRRYANRITRDGDLVLHGDRYRDQGRNQQDCLERLRQLIVDVSQPPKARRPTRPGRGAVERRLKDKRIASDRKNRRRFRSDE